MQDTIPEQESEHTRRFRVERAEVEQVAARGKQQSTLIALLVSALIGGPGAGGTYVAMQRETAQLSEQVRSLERETSAARTELGDIGALQRDVSALTAKVDAWRSADLASRATERAELERRLTRLEELLDRRR